jgi:dihydrofolate reductase
MPIALVVAVAQNGVIGGNNQLLWHLPADLRHFKTLTTGHRVVMGRKTYESIGRPLPNRTNVVISRQPGYSAVGCTVVASLTEALATAQAEETVFVIGGGEIYRQALPLADKIYLTEVSHWVAGDTTFPALSPSQWLEISRISHPADEKNLYAYDFVEYVKVSR